MKREQQQAKKRHTMAMFGQISLHPYYLTLPLQVPLPPQTNAPRGAGAVQSPSTRHSRTVPHDVSLIPTDCIQSNMFPQTAASEPGRGAPPRTVRHVHARIRYVSHRS
jgi:hypothetical protein